MLKYAKLCPLLVYIVGILFVFVSCYGPKNTDNSPVVKMQLEIDTQKEMIQRLETELEHEKNKPVVIKYVDKIVEKEQESMTAFKILGMWMMGLSIGASVILHFLIPTMWYFGLAGFATGGGFYYLALTNQFLTPFMPYIMMGVVSLIFLGACVYIYYRVDWTNSERQGLADIVEGADTFAAQKLLKDVFMQPKRTFLPTFKIPFKK